MKRLLALTLALMMVLTLAACAGTSSSSSAAPSSEAESSSSVPEKKDPVKLEYWFEGAGAERTPTHERIINEYNAQSDYITVEGVYVDLTSGGDKINVAWAGGAMPDVIYTQPSWQSSMFSQNMCLPLDDLFAAWDEKDQFDPSTVQAIRSNDMEGRLCAVPTSYNLTGIWYRKDVFAEKNVDAPTTWDNFFASCEKLTDKAAGVYGHTLRGGSGSMNQLIYEMVAYVGKPDFFDSEGKACLLRDPLAAEYVTRFVDIYKKGQTPESGLTAGYKEMVADFNANLAMTLIHNLGSYENQSKTFTPDQYAFVPFPPAVNGKLATVVPVAKGIAISSTCKHVDEAWDYTKWNCSEQAISDINEMIGEIPSRIDSASHDWVKNAPHMNNLPAFSAAEKVAVLVPTYLPDFNTIEKTEMEPVFQSVLTGNLSVEEMMDTWASKFEAAYAEYAKATGLTELRR